MSESFLNGRVTLHSGDMLSVLDTLPENSVDSVVCDPPYHLHSIVARFAKTGRTESTATKSGPHQRTATGFMGRTWDGGDIAFQPDTWARVLRVLKPGGYILAFSSSRTFGRMSVALEDAGFITHPMIGWLFGSGFPKATRIKAEGYEGQRYGAQALKPALEPIYMGQKPFSEETGTANVLKHGTGAVNIDACRVGAGVLRSTGNGKRERNDGYGMQGGVIGGSALGRWPGNLIHDGSDAVVEAFPETVSGTFSGKRNEPKTSGVYGSLKVQDEAGHVGDSGSAARFFYSAKADGDTRIGSKHPTVKPLDLIRYLTRLVTPANGIVLDCFAGTGTTGEAAYREGFSAVLIEREPEYQADIRRRMALVLAGPDERRHAIIKERQRGKPEDLSGTLFAPSAIAAE